MRLVFQPSLRSIPPVPSRAHFPNAKLGPTQRHRFLLRVFRCSPPRNNPTDAAAPQIREPRNSRDFPEVFVLIPSAPPRTPREISIAPDALPDTFLYKHNPDQFEIVGLGCGDLAKQIGVGKNHRGRTDVAYRINGEDKCPYSRIIIRRRPQ